MSSSKHKPRKFRKNRSDCVSLFELSKADYNEQAPSRSKEPKPSNCLCKCGGCFCGRSRTAESKKKQDKGPKDIRVSPLFNSDKADPKTAKSCEDSWEDTQDHAEYEMLELDDDIEPISQANSEDTFLHYRVNSGIKEDKRKQPKKVFSIKHGDHKLDQQNFESLEELVSYYQAYLQVQGGKNKYKD
ncbi:hypothetical protein DdX_03559 [Ditylenchus destructor]|uniref:Uncharacterized protein n=1 Tax=Ditylenchus destructor TaxID=166010 RepID=A0AAD4RBE7_9BILA|nr:hypothetical protein DdX_03559 [Ditylenchus destructor]